MRLRSMCCVSSPRRPTCRCSKTSVPPSAARAQMKVFRADPPPPGFAPNARAVALRPKSKGVSDESGRAIQGHAFTFDYSQEKVRRAAPQRRVLAQKLQRWFIGAGLQMRGTLVSVAEQSGLSAENWLQARQVDPWPFRVTSVGSVVCAKTECKKGPLSRLRRL